MSAGGAGRADAADSSARGAGSGLRPRLRAGRLPRRPAAPDAQHVARLRRLQRRPRAGGQCEAGACVQAVGVLSGWGEGVAALPADAREAAAAATPGDPADAPGRSTASGSAAPRASACWALPRSSDAGRCAAWTGRRSPGPRTALLFVTAGGVRRIEPSSSSRGGRGPCTSRTRRPRAVSAEVAIEFGLTGAYVILIGGPAATLRAIWQARPALARRARCDRALVLAVETFEECEDSVAAGALAHRRRPWWKPRRALWLEPRDGRRDRRAGSGSDAALEAAAQTRAGSTLACGPLVALALAPCRPARGATRRQRHLAGASAPRSTLTTSGRAAARH